MNDNAPLPRKKRGRPTVSYRRENEIAATVLRREGLTVVEIAQRLNVDHSTVVRYLQRAKRNAFYEPDEKLVHSTENMRIMRKVTRTVREVYNSLPKFTELTTDETVKLKLELRDAILLQGVQLNHITNSILTESLQAAPDLRLIDVLEKAAAVCARCILTLEKMGVPGWDPGNSVIQHDDSHNWRTAILTVLDDYPEIKGAIIDQLHRGYSETTTN